MKKIVCLLITLPLFVSIVKAQECKVLDEHLVGSYVGDCKNGKASGTGKAVGLYSYEGEFRQGLPDGKGILTDDKGVIFKGVFKKGKREGQGLQIVKDRQGKDSTVSGYWKNDIYIGLNEHAYKLVAKTFQISSVSISEEIQSPPNSIELSMENISFGDGLKGLTPKPTLTDLLFESGSYQVMTTMTQNDKRNSYSIKNISFPANIVFKIGTEQVQIEFLEPRNFKVFITVRN